MRTLHDVDRCPVVSCGSNLRLFQNKVKKKKRLKTKQGAEKKERPMRNSKIIKRWIIELLS